MDDQLPDDGLKWFGEGFDGFPKRLPDDCVEYIIQVIDSKLENIAAIRSRLNKINKAANELKKKHLKDYIWQRDAYDLSIHPKLDVPQPIKESSAPPHLRGRTNFGDSVADEWTIVYLLMELSKKYPEAWIRVYDTDGEFLLIEAANSLPKWLNPEIAENRIWINDGHLKIIPLEADSMPRNLSLQDALSKIRNTPKALLVDAAIEKEAFHRLSSYPDAIASSFHHSLTTIPRNLACILHRNPAYISPAVEAFYLRDPISLKPLNTKDTSTLNFPPEDFVTVNVKFTKVGFAQLRSQIFDPPPAWTGIIPRMHDEKVARGMKLASGFEMLVSDAQNQDKRVLREMKLLLEDIETGEEKLPTDAEIAEWPRIEDDEKWLDIDYNDFEDELDGKATKSGKDDEKSGFGDTGAQENLRKMVSRFQDFLEDDEAGAEGVDDMDDDDDDDDENEDSDEASEAQSETGDEKSSNTDEAEFEKSIKKTMSMPIHHVEESGLLEEARKLALEDDEDASEVDEDEEMRKVIEIMEKELKGHGALNLDTDGKAKGKGKGKAPVTNKTDGGKAVFGPERPPHLQSQAVKKSVTFEDEADVDEEFGPGDGELSSDDEDAEDGGYNDVDLGLAKNMLEAFKGQTGMGGPAGNLMKALGVGMPRDEDIGEEEEVEKRFGKGGEYGVGGEGRDFLRGGKARGGK